MECGNELKNMRSRALLKPIQLQPVFSNFPYYGTKIAETLFDIGLCLPSGTNLQVKHRERIANVVKSIFK